jgi:hypothetical protein
MTVLWRRANLLGRFRHIALGLVAAVGVWIGATAAVWAQGGDVELELVLALDASASVQRNEFDLQAQGLAQAFRHPEVVQALTALNGRQVAVTVVQWSSPARQRVAIPWTLINDRAGAEALSERLAAMPRYVASGGTATGQAIVFAQRQFRENGYRGARRVIDVSGDGRANMGRHPAEARQAAVAAGIIINGLAILNEEADVDRFYADHVIGGPGAFLMTATNYTTFREAIRHKLVREILGMGMVKAPSAPDATGVSMAQRPHPAIGGADLAD